MSEPQEQHVEDDAELEMEDAGTKDRQSREQAAALNRMTDSQPVSAITSTQLCSCTVYHAQMFPEGPCCCSQRVLRMNSMLCLHPAGRRGTSECVKDSAGGLVAHMQC
jgi:hypothetical protein